MTIKNAHDEAPRADLLRLRAMVVLALAGCWPGRPPEFKANQKGDIITFFWKGYRSAGIEPIKLSASELAGVGQAQTRRFLLIKRVAEKLAQSWARMLARDIGEFDLRPVFDDAGVPFEEVAGLGPVSLEARCADIFTIPNDAVSCTLAVADEEAQRKSDG